MSNGFQYYSSIGLGIAVGLTALSVGIMFFAFTIVEARKLFKDKDEKDE